MQEALNITGTTLQPSAKPTQSVDSGRRELEKVQPDIEKVSSNSPDSVQSEELLNQIKALTENGLYSVRFENNPEFAELIVKVVDTKTDEIIREIPAEEILGMRAHLAELRGQLIDTVE